MDFHSIHSTKCSTHLTLLLSLPPHMKENEMYHHGAIEEGFFGGVFYIQLSGHVGESALLIPSAPRKKQVCKHLMTPLVSDPQVLPHGCSTMGAPIWVLHHGCSTMCPLQDKGSVKVG